MENNIENNIEGRFYVYAYLDTRKPGEYAYKGNEKEFVFNFEPFYIGKGEGKRMFAHLSEKENAYGRKNNTHKIRKIKKITTETGKHPEIIVINSCLLESDAYILESQVIKIIGREDLKNGPLTNKTDGGFGNTNCGGNIKQICQFSLYGDFIKEWDSISKAATYIKTDVSNISSCLIKKSKTASGYLWFYRDFFKKEIPPKLDSVIVNNLIIIENNKYKKSVVQFSETGNLIKVWPSIAEASVEVCVFPGSIANACIGKSKTAGGFIWFFKSFFNKNKITKKLDSAIVKELINKEHHYAYKKVIQYLKTGELIKIWPSIKEASNSLNINSGSISHVCAKKVKTAGGFIWEYFEKNIRAEIYLKEKINQFSINGIFVRTWNSLSEIGDTTNMTKDSIYKTCIKQQLTSYGFIWRYAKDGIDILEGEVEIVKKLIKRKLIQISSDNKIIKIWNNLISAAKELKIDRSSISRAASPTNKIKSAGGFIWKYAE